MIHKFLSEIKSISAAIKQYINYDKAEIDKNNLHTLRIVSRVSFVLVLFFMLLTPVFIWKWQVSAYHIILVAGTFLVSVVSEIMTRGIIKNNHLVHITIAFFMVLLMSMFTALDTIESPYAAETFMVGFLIIAPVIFIISIEHMLVCQAVYTIFFLIMVYTFKEERMIGGDSIQAIYGCAVGIVLYGVVMRLRLQEFRQKSIYKVSSEVDYLTQVYNRAASKHAIDLYLEQKHDEESCAMVVLDVDRFKEVNDKLGHENGDEVLKQVAAILKSVFRKSDIVGRFGGDEFVIFLKDLSDKEIVTARCMQVNECMKNVLDGKFRITCSMGVCFLQQGTAADEEMFRVADEALYEAKAFGKATHVCHDFNRKEQAEDEMPMMVIVDDNMVDRETLAIQFEEKFRIEKIASSKEAFAYIQDHAKEIDIILLDMIMPEENGFDVLKRIKARPEMAWIPVVAVSSDFTMEEKALEYGAEEMITKPIVPAVTKLRVANVMKNRKK